MVEPAAVRPVRGHAAEAGGAQPRGPGQGHRPAPGASFHPGRLRPPGPRRCGRPGDPLRNFRGDPGVESPSARILRFEIGPEGAEPIPGPGPAGAHRGPPQRRRPGPLRKNHGSRFPTGAADAGADSGAGRFRRQPCASGLVVFRPGGGAGVGAAARFVGRSLGREPHPERSGRERRLLARQQPGNPPGLHPDRKPADRRNQPRRVAGPERHSHAPHRGRTGPSAGGRSSQGRVGLLPAVVLAGHARPGPDFRNRPRERERVP